MYNKRALGKGMESASALEINCQEGGDVDFDPSFNEENSDEAIESFVRASLE